MEAEEKSEAFRRETEALLEEYGLADEEDGHADDQLAFDSPYSSSSSSAVQRGCENAYLDLPSLSRESRKRRSQQSKAPNLSGGEEGEGEEEDREHGAGSGRRRRRSGGLRPGLPPPVYVWPDTWLLKFFLSGIFFLLLRPAHHSDRVPKNVFLPLVTSFSSFLSSRVVRRYFCIYSVSSLPVLDDVDGQFFLSWRFFFVSRFGFLKFD